MTMHFPLFIIALSFALLVLLAGLFMKNHVAKQDMGRFAKIASSVAIFFGTFVFIFAFVMHIMMMCCHNSCGKESGSSCGKESGSSCHCNKEMQGCGEMNCKKDKACCGETKEIKVEKKVITKH